MLINGNITKQTRYFYINKRRKGCGRVMHLVSIKHRLPEHQRLQTALCAAFVIGAVFWGAQAQQKLRGEARYKRYRANTLSKFSRKDKISAGKVSGLLKVYHIRYAVVNCDVRATVLRWQDKLPTAKRQSRQKVRAEM